MDSMNTQNNPLQKIAAPQWLMLLQQWLVYLDIAPRSQVSYKNALMRFLRWLSERRITQPTRETILQFKLWMDEANLKPFTRAHYFVVVRRFFTWTELMGLYPNITLGVKSIRRTTKYHHKDALTPQQVKAVLSAIDTTTLQGKRDFALITLLVHTGLRLIEVQRADITDIAFDDSLQEGESILWVRGKGRSGKDAFVVLTKTVLCCLEDYFITRKKVRGIRGKKLRSKIGQALFISLSDRNFGQRITIHSLSRLIKNLFRAARINSSRLTAHSLRHTFGVLSLRSGASLYEVQLALRHSSPVTTEIYLADIEQQKRKEAAPERFLEEIFK